MFSDGTVECKSHEIGYFFKEKDKVPPRGSKTQSATEGLKNIAYVYVSMYYEFMRLNSAMR